MQKLPLKWRGASIAARARRATRLALWFVLALLVYCLSAAATASCQLDDPSRSETSMLLMGSVMTVGADLPLGAELYRQSFRGSVSGVTCQGSGAAAVSWRISNGTPRLHSGTGDLYETGVAGIGLRFLSRGQALPGSSNSVSCASDAGHCKLMVASEFEIVLIKTGQVAPGRIDAAALPVLEQVWHTPQELMVQRTRLSGRLHIVSQTCRSADVLVNLGTHLHTEFQGVGSVSAWQDFSITLSNCPAFHGNYAGSTGAWANGMSLSAPTRLANAIFYRLDPVGRALDAKRGILALANATDTATASGVGIQIANAEQQPVPFHTWQDSALIPSTVEGASYHIHLKSRYIQTAPTVTSGRADGAVLFTIHYY